MVGRRRTGSYPRPARRGLVAALAAAATGVTLGASSAAPGAAAGTAAWRLRLAIHYLPPATNRSQYDVVLVESGRTWFLGGSDVGGHGDPKVEQIRNGVPRSAPLPSGPHSWITAASAPAPADIWAVTYLGGSVLHWDGAKWITAPRGGWKTGTRFTGIIAVSQSDVWVFGTRGHRFPGAGTWHFSGTRWTRVQGAAGGIFQASKAGRADAWAIGNAGSTGNALLHFGGSAWRRVRPPALAGFRYTHVLALAPADVWVAGSVAGVPRLGHFDGHGWRALAMPGKTAATGMCRDGRGGLWVIANSGASPSLVRDRAADGTWTRAVVSSKAANAVLACALVRGTQRAWGAGKAVAPHGSAAAAYRYG